MWMKWNSIVRNVDTPLQSIEFRSKLGVKDLYAYRLTRNKWTTFIMATQDTIGEFLDY